MDDCIFRIFELRKKISNVRNKSKERDLIYNEIDYYYDKLQKLQTKINDFTLLLKDI